MQLSVKGLAIASALLWGGGILTVGLVNLAVPSYGVRYLELMSSLYPGFHGSGTLVDVLVGAGYGIVDGGIAGCLFGWIYNLFTRRLGPAG